MGRPPQGEAAERRGYDGRVTPTATPPDAHGFAVAKSSAWVLLREIWRFSLAIAATAILGKGLSEAAFGFLTLVATLYAFGQVVLDHGVGTILTRDIARRPEDEAALLAEAAGWRVIVGLGLAVVIAVFAVVRRDGAETAWLLGVAATMPLLAPSVFGVACLVRQDLGPVSLIASSTQAGFLAMAFAGTALGVPGPAFASLHMVRETVGPWILARVVATKYALSIRPRRPGALLFGRFSAVGAQAVTSLAVAASTHVGVLLVEARCDPAALGAYGAAIRLTLPFSLLVAAMTQPLLPALSSLWTRDVAAFRRRLAGVLAFGACVGVAGLLVTGMAGPSVVAMLYGGKYLADGGNAAHVIAWAGGAFCAVCLGAPATTALVAAGGERQLRNLVLSAFVVNVAVAIVAIPSLGPAGAAVGLLAGEAVTAVGATAAVVGLLARRGADA